MKRLFSLFGALILLSVTFWFLFYLYERYRFVITDNAYQNADIVNVSPEDVSGYIIKLYKKEYERVKSGEPLFKIDDSTLKKDLSSLQGKLNSLVSRKRELETKLSRLEKQLPESVKSTEFELSSLKRELSSLKENLKEAEVKYSVLVNSAKASLSAAREAYEASNVNLERMEKRFKRYKELYRRRVISEQQFDDVKSAYYQALSQFKTAESNLKLSQEKLKEAEAFSHTVNSLKEKISSTRERIGALQSQLESKRADLKKISELKASISEIAYQIDSLKAQIGKTKLLISHTLVKSPIDGLIAKKWKEEGDFVSPGITVYSIYNPKTFYVLAWIDEDDIRYVKKGSRALIELETCKGQFRGEVTAVGTSAGSVFALIPRDTSQGEYVKVTQRVPVKIKVFNVPLRCIKPGTNVSVKIPKE